MPPLEEALKRAPENGFSELVAEELVQSVSLVRRRRELRLRSERRGPVEGVRMQAWEGEGGLGDQMMEREVVRSKKAANYFSAKDEGELGEETKADAPLAPATVKMERIGADEEEEDEIVVTPSLNATNLSIEEEKAIAMFHSDVLKKKNYEVPL